MTTLIVIAKECIPGKVKTRLHPALTLEAAARIAYASLRDTLVAVSALPAGRRILYLDGATAPPEAAGYEVIQQSLGTLDERIAEVFDLCDGPTVLIGMDTPQVSASTLGAVFTDWPSGVDSWFGPADDGGFWALGLAEPNGQVVRGVPMSRSDTGALQRRRLEEAGLVIGTLPSLLDIDTVEDLEAVAATMRPASFLAQALGEIRAGVVR
jgi:uncharacterized protein